MRLAFHPDESVYVLSLWRYDTCLQTFRLQAAEAPELVQAIVGALAQPYASDPRATDTA